MDDPPCTRDHRPTNLKPLNPGAESGGEAYAHDDDRDGVLCARRPQPREGVCHRLLYPDPDAVLEVAVIIAVSRIMQ